jgi:hypothetical protein
MAGAMIAGCRRRLKPPGDMLDLFTNLHQPPARSIGAIPNGVFMDAAPERG